MKACKKAVALLLCLCLVASGLAFAASAEDETKPVGFDFGYVKAIKLKADDPETVLQLEMTLTAHAKPDGTPNSFDTLNSFDEIAIYEGLSAYAGMIMDYSEKPGEKALIAKARPVSFEKGVLTADVYAKDGTVGAKMISLSAKEILGETDVNLFVFDLPEGLVKDSARGLVNAGAQKEAYVKGLAVKEYKLPRLVAGIIKDAFSGNLLGIELRAALLLPIIPLVVFIAVNRLNRIYKVYDINIFKLARGVIKALRDYFVSRGKLPG